MVYIMKIHVDGGCRGNGQPGSIAAAAAMKTKYGTYYYNQTKALPSYPWPTNQRAEIAAIILCLEQALERYGQVRSTPRLKATIYSDSIYAVNCMNKWVYKWANNRWKNTGNEVVNRDLIEGSPDLVDLLRGKGKMRFVWIPREKKRYAD